MRTFSIHFNRVLRPLILLLLSVAPLSAAVKDVSFLQDISIKITLAPELNGADFKRVVIDRDGVVFVLTSKGVARLFDQTLALDRSFRPLNGIQALDITKHNGDLYYLFEDRFLSNGSAGEPFTTIPKGNYKGLALAEGSVTLLNDGSTLNRLLQGKLSPIEGLAEGPIGPIQPWRNEFFVGSGSTVYRVFGGKAKAFTQAPSPITALALRATELLIGTTNGYLGVSVNDAKPITPIQLKLPCNAITRIFSESSHELWIGSKRGAFRVNRDGQIAYYASKRWLNDDEVVDLAKSPEGDVYVLTKTGLNKIDFSPMNLADKAAFFDKKVRQRHNRFGFAAELHLVKPGDITSAEMIDTDNDGTWSNYYMASQAFRYGTTGDAEARTNAWRTFQAMERLERLPGLKGFPARSFERKGFKVSDPQHWHETSDSNWEWKGTTSSDEIAAHTFGCAVMYEIAAKNPTEKERVSRFYEKIVTHILQHNWYLVDADGKPTLWGRWHPDYVNWFPETIGDRRLNSAEMIASLQLAYKMTNKELYKKKAFELIDKYGYLTNIMISASNAAPTKGFIHQGIDMGDIWNHSDDLLSFITYYVLHRFAFNEELRTQYAATIREHWEMEKSERNPLWNFIYSATGARDYDLDGALWTLRKFPLDSISWSIHNSERNDVTKLPKSFRGYQLKELLSPSERPMTRWNTHPFVLDGGDGGSIEFAGDEYLLPYWMGRYLKIIR